MRRSVARGSSSCAARLVTQGSQERLRELGLLSAMGWADGHIARLALGETVKFRPRGHSMTGKIFGRLIAIEP